MNNTITPDAPEIIGFGALNVDYIASASLLSQRMSDRITESAARFESNKEEPVDQEIIARAIENLGAASLSYSLGGSAWLTIFALAQMRVMLRLGYIGVVGRVEAPGLSFISQMDELGIDHRWVSRYPGQPCGLCLSYIEDSDRVMLTNPGANLQMSNYIRENFDSLAAYIASARYVHATSFLDDTTPVEMLRLLKKAKEINGALQISFDPGCDWAEHLNADVEGILAITDLLFVNYREFKALGRYAPGEPDIAVAKKILDMCAIDCRVFVTKRYDFVTAFRARPEGILAYRFQLSRPPRETDLEDATGAGDIFAAAVLSSLSARRLQVELGAFVGLCLARHKMRKGPQGNYRTLPDLSKGFLQQTETLSRADTQPAGIFLVHDDDPYWRAVRRFIVEDCGLAVHEMNSSAIDDNNIAAMMAEQLSHCSFAVCVLTRGKPPIGEHASANQNLVHQAGILQGRYGFERVAILAEQGCETFSNIAGLVRLDFAPDQVESTFFELERMFKREGLIRRKEGSRD